MANRQYIYIKATAPTVNDDTLDGYIIDDRWVDTTNDRTYQLIDSTAGAAIWLELPQPNKPKDQYKLSVTVSASDLIVALKTLAGNDPSATDKIYLNINGTIRTVSAATSITLADATNWFNAGAVELATKEIDFFAYAVWDSNSSIVALSVARIPYGSLVSDFSATTTNEKYLGNYANFTATDDVINIGRFAATLSAGAGYTWTVPTFTSLNLIHNPIYETRMINWVPAWTNLSVGNGTVTATYQIIGKRLYAAIELTFGSTTAISGSVDITFPFTRSTTLTTALGQVLLQDTGTVNNLGDLRYISSTIARFFARNASGTYETWSVLSSTVPHTWATTDVIATEYQYSL